VQLLTSQKNLVLKTIEKWHFDPREFVWGSRSGAWSGLHEDVPELRHTPTGFFCAFSIHTSDSGSPTWHPARQGMFTLLVSPGANHAQEVVNALKDFDAVAFQVGAWVLRIKRESAPDLWEQLNAQRRLIGDVVAGEPDNTPFTPAELPRVAAGLREVGQLAERLQLTAEEVKRLTAGVDYLVEAAPRMGRKDWFLLAVALLTWGMPAEKAIQLAQGLFQAVQWMVHAHPVLRP